LSVNARTRSLGCALLAVAGICIYDAGHAQTYPSRPIRILVGFPAGGAADMTPRTLAAKMSEALGQPIVIDNRGGAHGNIASEIVMNAKPDGHTLLSGTLGTLVINKLLYKGLTFDPATDLVPIAMTVSFANVVLVHPSIPAATLPELITLARSKPGALSYASPGTGSPAHLTMELLKGMTKIDIVHIPYKGGGPAMTDLLAGQVQVLLTTAPTAAPQVRAGKIRALAVTTKTRSPSLPEVPTIAEATGLSTYESNNWHGMMAPPGTARAIVAKLSTQTKAALESKDVKDRLRAQGLDPSWTTPEEFAAYLKSESAKWSRVARESKVTVE
jgi:tripartite-type tricarboxylate transporter receptor subunit TctC